MRIAVMVPCYVDLMFPGVGIAAVELLERLGHDVRYPEGFACCGQPAFNAGYVDQARTVARRVLELYDGSDAVVVPSGSCATMARCFYEELFADPAEKRRAADLADRVWEFSAFLVDRLGIEDVGARLHARATYHDGCHGLRELGIRDQPRRLLAGVEGLELVEMDERDTCCGFGGTFATKFTQVSTAMAEVKAGSIARTGADLVISGDSSCIMHLQGYLSRQRSPVRCMHLAEVLACR